MVRPEFSSLTTIAKREQQRRDPLSFRSNCPFLSFLTFFLPSFRPVWIQLNDHTPVLRLWFFFFFFLFLSSLGVVSIVVRSPSSTSRFFSACPSSSSSSSSPSIVFGTPVISSDWYFLTGSLNDPRLPPLVSFPTAISTHISFLSFLSSSLLRLLASFVFSFFLVFLFLSPRPLIFSVFLVPSFVSRQSSVVYLPVLPVLPPRPRPRPRQGRTTPPPGAPKLPLNPPLEKAKRNSRHVIPTSRPTTFSSCLVRLARGKSVSSHSISFCLVLSCLFSAPGFFKKKSVLKSEGLAISSYFAYFPSFFFFFFFPFYNRGSFGCFSFVYLYRRFCLSGQRS